MNVHNPGQSSFRPDHAAVFQVGTIGQEYGAPYLRARQVLGIRRVAIYTLAANVAAAVFVCVLAWGLAPAKLLAVWILAVAGLDAARVWSLRRNSVDTVANWASRRFLRWLVGQTALTALLYGGLLAYLYPRLDPFGLLIASSITAGLIASGALTSAVIPQSAIAWVGILTACSYYVLLTNVNPQTWLLAALLTLYAVFITAAALFSSRQHLASELNETRARTRLVEAIESLSVGFLLWDRDRRLILTNGLGDDILDDLGKRGIPGSQAAVSKPVRDGSPEDPIELRASNGRWYGVRQRVTREDGVVAICFDITDRKAAQEAVAREARRYQTILKTASDGIHVVDEDGRLVEASASFLCALGYPDSPLPDITVADWDVEIKPEEIREVVLRRLAMPPGIFETQHRRRDGTLIDVEVSAQAVMFDGRKYLYCSARNITERKAAKEAVEREARRYQTILKAASDGIHVLDEDGRLVEASPSFLRELGYPESPVPELSLSDWDVHVKADNLRAFMQSRLDRPPGVFESQHRRRDGTIYDVEIGSQTVVFDGRRYRYCSSRNITERKRAAAQRAALERQLRHSLKLEAVGQLTGGVAHDFNNLLAVLLGRLQLIEEETQDNPTVHEWARNSIDVVQRGASLTRSLLAFSRQQPLVPVSVDLNAIAGDMAEMMKRTLGETIDIQVIGASDLWRCEVDPGQLQNALLNLGLNARDAMGESGQLVVETGNIHVSASDAEYRTDIKPGDFVMLSVSDNGAGMPPEVLERVFEPFYTTKDTGKGSGLGLSMVYGFVTQSGGHIKIDSEVGRGTTVRIYLPRAKDAQPAAEEAARQPLKTGHEAVLLVEDDEDLRLITQMQLKRLGYRAFAAGDAESGLALLLAHTEIALLLTDIVLPRGVNGIELGERALALRPNLKLLYMTGYAEQVALESLRLTRPARVLHKPFHSGELASTIRAELDEAGAPVSDGR